MGKDSPTRAMESSGVCSTSSSFVLILYRERSRLCLAALSINFLPVHNRRGSSRWLGLLSFGIEIAIEIGIELALFGSVWRCSLCDAVASSA